MSLGFKILKNKAVISLFVFFSFLTLTLSVQPAFAQGTFTGATAQLDAGARQAGFDTTRTVAPQSIVAGIVRIFLSLLGTIFIVLMLMSGYWFLTARGEEEKLTKAKKTMRGSVIGFFIVVIAYGITAFVVRGTQNALSPEEQDRSTGIRDGRFFTPLNQAPPGT